MPRSTTTSAVRGVAPASCPRCKRETVEKDYRWRKTGACHRTCKWCEDRVRRARAAANHAKRISRQSWTTWRKVMEGWDD